MKLTFKNYKLAYDQTDDVYKLIQNEGARIIYNLGVLCDGLKAKWIGDDAPEHVNSLLNIQHLLKTYFESSTTMIVEVSNRVVDIHSAIHDISGTIIVPPNLVDKFDSDQVKDEVEKNRGYTLESLKDEYRLLIQIMDDFTKFKTEYASKFDEFFKNWKDDPRKEKIEEKFDDFIKHMDDYQQTMERTRVKLEKVVANTEQILEEKK